MLKLTRKQIKENKEKAEKFIKEKERTDPNNSIISKIICYFPPKF